MEADACAGGRPGMSPSRLMDRRRTSPRSGQRPAFPGTEPGLDLDLDLDLSRDRDLDLDLDLDPSLDVDDHSPPPFSSTAFPSRGRTYSPSHSIPSTPPTNSIDRSTPRWSQTNGTVDRCEGKSLTAKASRW